MMKKSILIFSMVLCVLLSFLMIKTAKRNFTHRSFQNLGLDSALLYTSYYTVNMEDVSLKITFPPSFLTSYFNNDTPIDGDILLGYHCKPSDTIGFYKYYQALPIVIKSVIDKKLIGIYFYENLPVDGLLLTVHGRNRGYVIALNKRILSKNLSEYLSDNENSRFVPSSYWVAINTSDTVFNALFYILLHECFHIFDYENKISTPNNKLGNYSKIKSSFITKCWQYPTVPREAVFSNSYLIGDLYDKIGNKLIDSCLIVPIYTELSKGYFASYYSTVSYQEDVAEYLTWYYITQYFKSEYEIKIFHNNENLMTFRPFENRQLLERFNDFNSKIKYSLIN